MVIMPRTNGIVKAKRKITIPISHTVLAAAQNTSLQKGILLKDLAAALLRNRAANARRTATRLDNEASLLENPTESIDINFQLPR
jgi:hypothetical protein